MSGETAMEIARAALSQISTHEQVCAERWSAMRSDMRELKGSSSRQSWMMISILVAVLGWAGSQIYGNIAVRLPSAPASFQQTTTSSTVIDKPHS